MMWVIIFMSLLVVASFVGAGAILRQKEKGGAIAPAVIGSILLTLILLGLCRDSSETGKREGLANGKQEVTQLVCERMIYLGQPSKLKEIFPDFRVLEKHSFASGQYILVNANEKQIRIEMVKADFDKIEVSPLPDWKPATK